MCIRRLLDISEHFSTNHIVCLLSSTIFVRCVCRSLRCYLSNCNCESVLTKSYQIVTIISIVNFVEWPKTAFWCLWDFCFVVVAVSWFAHNHDSTWRSQTRSLAADTSLFVCVVIEYENRTVTEIRIHSYSSVDLSGERGCRTRHFYSIKTIVILSFGGTIQKTKITTLQIRWIGQRPPENNDEGKSMRYWHFISAENNQVIAFYALNWT